MRQRNLTLCVGVRASYSLGG
uniref:Uncharacterized protein n=1 Tax=Anguilla anguilla TaxID=7936 RepID=A0A0E9RF94_ANGAN